VASAVTSSASSAANGAAAASGAGTIVSFLWMGFALLFIAFLMCSYFTYNESYGRRMPHYVSLLICGLASLAYLSMATGNGSMVRADGRVFYWARYIDWLVTTPLLLFDIAMVAGIDNGEIIGLVGLDVLMIVAGLIGGTQPQEYRWVFWSFGMVTFLPIVYLLSHTISAKADAAGSGALYGKLMTLTVVAWVAYPVVWAIGEGAGVIDETIEVLLYLILDVIAKAVFAFVLLTGKANANGERDGLLSATAATKR